MTVGPLGDRASLFAGLRHNADLRTRLDRLTREMGTGEAADPARHLKGDTAPLADLDRRLRLAEAYGAAAREAGGRLSSMGTVLDSVEDRRAALAQRLLGPEPGGHLDRAALAAAAESAFAAIAGSLNARHGEGALFAGTATGGPALAPAGGLLAAARAAAAGQATATGAAAALDAFFDDPAGGFAAMGYRGAQDPLARPLDEGETLALPATAADPALRGVLKAAALAALAADPALPEAEGQALLARSRDALLSAGDGLTALRARLGEAEAQAEGAAARHAARATAWGLMRQEMTAADPFATASELEAVRTRLETHYEMTRRLSSLSLASVLR